MEKATNYKDTFTILTSARVTGTKGVLRVRPRTYDMLAEVSQETGVSISRLVDQCVAFALERWEGNEDE
ncbi:MAG: ribbon-helix-helix domain-containing protein [Oscillospiraceae bacterium]|nr:ribbon-helix-helix domain-containing protein [Oscillospiraceae bacterium]